MMVRLGPLARDGKKLTMERVVSQTFGVAVRA